ncbi:MAG: hypothetical protein LBJ67_15335 [Planctomycetaceae bacterium]|nr:hypothetical protein [Planctomycetaceae bacterium]
MSKIENSRFDDSSSSENEQEQSLSLENNLELPPFEIIDSDFVIDVSEENAIDLESEKSADTLANAREFAFLEDLLSDNNNTNEKIQDPVDEISVPIVNDSDISDINELNVMESDQSEEFTAERITSEFSEWNEEIPETVTEETNEEPTNFFELPEEDWPDENIEEDLTVEISDSSETLEEISLVIDPLEYSPSEDPLVVVALDTTEVGAEKETVDIAEFFNNELEQTLEFSELSNNLFDENIELDNIESVDEQVPLIIESFDDHSLIEEPVAVATLDTTEANTENEPLDVAECLDNEPEQMSEFFELGDGEYGENIELFGESDLLEQMDSLLNNEESVSVEQSEEQSAEILAEPIVEEQLAVDDSLDEIEVFSSHDIAETQSTATAYANADQEEDLNDLFGDLEASEPQFGVSLENPTDELLLDESTTLESSIETSDETVDLLVEFPETTVTETATSELEAVTETVAAEDNSKTKKKSKKEKTPKSPKVKKEKVKKEKPSKPQRLPGEKKSWTIGLAAFGLGIVMMVSAFAAVNARVIFSDGLSGMWYVWLGAFDILAVASIAIAFWVRKHVKRNEAKRTEADVAIGIAAISALIGCMFLLIHLIYLGNV